MGTALVAARETGSEAHLQESVFSFRKLAFSLVSSSAVSVLGAILCETDLILFQKV